MHERMRRIVVLVMLEDGLHPATDLDVLAEFPDHDGARMVGNLLGDPRQDVEIGARVQAVFEHHQDDDPAHTLVHWEVV